ncbi:MAG: hypothetical protein JOZ73_09060 [Solirubrobacterales bacterium]|nr:hypothetical protein [Solirubrobacterales bacterium]
MLVEMVSGTIATALGEADPHDVRRATELIAAACCRVVEHLQLALELSRRKHGDAGGGPGPAYG